MASSIFRIRPPAFALITLLAVPIVLLSPLHAEAVEVFKGEGSDGILLEGEAYLRYHFRDGSSEETGSDQDLYQYLSLGVGDPYEDRFSGAFFGRLYEDIDGVQDVFGYQPFESIDDTYEHKVHGQLYHAYLDAARVGPIRKLRAGRQFYYGTESLHFDGLFVDVPVKGVPVLQGLTLKAFGGVPVHLYESDPSGDWLAGAAFEVRPCDGTRIRLDYAHVRDEGGGVSLSTLVPEQENDLYSVSVTHRTLDRVTLYGQSSFLDDDWRDLSARAVMVFEPWDLTIRSTYYYLAMSETLNTIDLDHYTAIANTYHPYHQFGLSAYKGLGEHFAVEVDLAFRVLGDDDDEGAFNHQFDRYRFSAMSYDVPLAGLDLVFFLDYWETRESRSDRASQQILALGGEIQKELFETLQLSCGTDYSRYKYDAFSPDEREDVQTYYGRIRWDACDFALLQVDYVYEDGELEELNIVKALAKVRF